MTNALTIYGQFDQLQRAALALNKSGYFKDVQSEAQAIVKVMAGAELGLPPFASMTGIHIIQGKPVLGANVLATLVKNDPRYDYRIKVASDNACVLEWLEEGRTVGEAGFTMDEAKAAGLTGKDNWKKYPSDMLFARAISRGARRFAPGIFGGSPVYTPDEMGADVDAEGYVEAEVVDVTDQDNGKKTPDEIAAELGFVKPKKAQRPLDPESLKDAIATKASKATGQASDVQRQIIAKHLNAILEGDTQRKELTRWLLGVTSTKDLTDGQVFATLDWLGVGGYDDPPNQYAMTEARTAHQYALKAQGQQDLFNV